MVEEEPVLMMVVGIPGSGKSTFLEAMHKSKQYEFASYISADNLRTFTQVGEYAIINMEKEPKVHARLNYLFTDAINDHHHILLDQTNLTKKKREKYIKLARQAGYKIIIYYFNLDLELCLKNNLLRTKSCPEEHIKKCFASIEAPTTDECDYLLQVGDPIGKSSRS